MKKFFAVAAMLGLVTSAQAASLATINSVSGAVLVNKGEGFVSVSDLTELKAGDKVFVGEGGFASVSYAECVVTLDKPMVHAVTKVAPCNVITPAADLDEPAAAGLAGLPILPLVLIGGAAVIGGAIIINEVLEDDAAS
jgi:hypothetical protein